MPQQLEIKQIRKKGRNYLVLFTDDSEALIVPSVLESSKFKPGRIIEPELLSDILFKSDLIRARDYVNYLLAQRSYSSGHIITKMKEKGYAPKICELTIRYLTEQGLLDDRSFAVDMAESILRTKPAGRVYIVNKLRQKYIPARMAQAVVDELFKNVDEIDLAVRLLRGRWRYFSKFDLETARNKAYNYLSRRSINYHAAKEAFEKLLKEE